MTQFTACGVRRPLGVSILHTSVRTAEPTCCANPDSKSMKGGHWRRKGERHLWHGVRLPMLARAEVGVCGSGAADFRHQQCVTALAANHATRRCRFELPRRAAVLGVVICLGLSTGTVHLARGFTGIVSAGLLLTGGIFAVLAAMVPIRRFAFPRTLELTDEGIRFPHGYPWTTISTIGYADVVRIQDHREGLTVVTGQGHYSITACCFEDAEQYHAVREFIGVKTSIALSPHAPRLLGWREALLGGPQLPPLGGGFPPPLVRWLEPEDWARYRTHVARSKPIAARLRREARFFARCLGVLVLPWLVLQLLHIPTSSAQLHLALSVVTTLFFTLIHWLNATYPVHTTEISFRDNGITRLADKQDWDWNYTRFCSWAVIEREFQGRMLQILLLQSPADDVALALADADVRDRAVRILRDKHLPELPELKPSWEGD